ncbi:hypothetical protein N7G274_007147 [Stereocaulon virgatum]|uniref:SMP-30/Gluconolactonase/LRE-like region domain-containing protein n=1 Tax=Stereocaulon virgatum TaxID=373712 RepID=A0ABR4A2T6_9LECA
MNRDTKKLEYIRKVWEESDGPGKGERMRFNDGIVDHEGRYWAGTMNDPKVESDFQAEGVVFRLDPDLNLHRMMEKVTIPNGIFGLLSAAVVRFFKCRRKASWLVKFYCLQE